MVIRQQYLFFTSYQHTKSLRITINYLVCNFLDNFIYQELRKFFV